MYSSQTGALREVAAKSKKALLERIGTESLASTAYERLRFDIISGVFRRRRTAHPTALRPL